MVCARCKMVVHSELEKHGYHPLDVSLGEVDIQETLTPQQHTDLNNALSSYGFELIEDKKAKLIEKVKNAVINVVHYDSDKDNMNISDYLGQKLQHDYSYLSKLFSEIEGTTIEQYLIAQRIERVKEWLLYDEMTLSEIANKMGYSDVAHLSRQFKKVTGITPSQFKQLKENIRRPLEEI